MCPHFIKLQAENSDHTTLEWGWCGLDFRPWTKLLRMQTQSIHNRYCRLPLQEFVTLALSRKLVTWAHP